MLRLIDFIDRCTDVELTALHTDRFMGKVRSDTQFSSVQFKMVSGDGVFFLASEFFLGSCLGAWIDCW